jgi:hypothetical protein
VTLLYVHICTRKHSPDRHKTRSCFSYNYNKFDAAYAKVNGVVYNPQVNQWREARDFWLDA